MTYSEANKRYKNESGPDYQRPDKERSYLRNGAMHLLNESGALLAVVHPDGAVTHGQMLAAWSRQLAAGMTAPRR